jgi:hypothetical protein
MISATLRARLVFATFSFLALIAVQASTCSAATIIVNETFEGYTSFPNVKPVSSNDMVNFGVPLTSEGADSNLWMGARIGPGGDPNGSGSINADIGVQEFGGPDSGNNTKVGRVGDTAALVLRLDLTGFASATLDFDWRTYLYEAGDEFVVAYYKGDGTAFQPGGLGTPNNKYDWFNDMDLGNGSFTWYNTNWTELLRSGPDDTFNHESFPLPGNDIVYVAFWSDDNSNTDFGKFDNVVVEAIVPEPGSLILIGLALLASAFGRRRAAR